MITVVIVRALARIAYAIAATLIAGAGAPPAVEWVRGLVRHLLP